eukprot:Gregarina_sp_Pseudo_9__5593@NODE_75_length_4573_cov_6_198721_g69_i0_p2_GENE_NODE_75_length_4573_cov_6_198721_g69_i0NODE_75_length_4573_cov_6_198721_g69_i0_p2_ORF_typecomplete_len659_score90_67zfRING_2/PF13639_6/1e10zfC3HC4_2/PF13923_6/2_2e03zfC3HC4_2/PF13923_6/1_3e08zfrbx1/PF12678_7/3e08zfC3HC4_3/PF13920_6/4_8e08zfRING_5/PF14634_6/5_4e07zfANAPC11/PF12861_7/3_3e06DUF2921/PF11145_8/6_8e06ProkRING_4/PF14447_6/1_4e05FANCL_C/PF11793_8/0_00079zfC3HC4/PF00097_25/0_00062zfRING_11/PF17123_5/0_00076Zn_rib
MFASPASLPALRRFLPLAALLLPRRAQALNGGDAACPAVPTIQQMVGHYAGFAVFHSLTTNHTDLGGPSRNRLFQLTDSANSVVQGVFGNHNDRSLSDSVWSARCNLVKSNNLFWQAYTAKFQIQDDDGNVIDFVTRGIRPTNSHTALVRGSSTQLQNEHDESTVVTRALKSVAQFILGSDIADDSGQNPFAESLDSDNDVDSADSKLNSQSPESVVDIRASNEAAEKALITDSQKCQVSGTIERYNHDLDDGDSGPPLESGSATFQRSPDLIARLTLGAGCKGAGRMISFSFRKFDVSYFRDQQTNVGIFVGLKTLAEMLLLGRQFKKVEAQRALLKTSWVTVAWSILFDAFEAGFFFGRQSLGNDVSLLSSLALVGLLKIVLVAAVEMRWLIVLQRARSTQRRQLEGDHNPLAWVKDMNKFIRWFAVFVVVALFVASRLFESFPEPVVILLCLFLVPQIIYNIYSGTRHPFHTSFILGILICRFVLPYLLWSKTGEELRPTPPVISSFAEEEAWPSWFVSPRIPSMFLDSIFGTLPRRPNSLMLSLIMVILAAQGIYLWLQNAWSPRAGLPPWFCDKFLPLVFDYELDVTRVAAIKQQADPSITMVDCVICMTGVKFADRQCVVTPCEHFFHKECLIKWMDVKLECPTCRRPLPPM